MRKGPELWECHNSASLQEFAEIKHLNTSSLVKTVGVFLGAGGIKLIFLTINNDVFFLVIIQMQIKWWRLQGGDD